MTGSEAQRSVNTPLLLVALVLAVLSYQLNSTMVNPLLVLISRDMGVDTGSTATVMSAFFAASGVGGMILARWSDALGRRRALLLVLALIGFGTLICALAPSFPILLVGRVFQGLGSAVFPLATLVIREYLPAPVFGPAIGVIAACNGGVLGFDGVLSGYLAQRFGFQTVFWLLLGVVAFSAVLVALSLPAGSRQFGSMDWKGAVALSIVVISVFQIVSILANGIEPELLVWSALLVVGAGAWWTLQKGDPNALVSWDSLRSRTFWPVLLVTFFSMAALVPMATYSLLIYAQDAEVGYGLGPTVAALWFLMPYALGGVLVAPIAGWFGARIGWIPVLRVGLTFGVIAAVILAATASSLALSVIASLLVGVAANGIAVASVNSLSVLQSPPSAPASLPAVNSAAFGLGISAGVAILAPQVAKGTMEGFTLAFVLSGLLSLVALVLTFVVKKAQTSEQ